MRRVAFTGRSGAGKTTAAEWLCLRDARYERLSFASSLKQTVGLLWPEADTSRRRTLHQQVGAVMRLIDPDVWVRKVEQHLEANPYGYYVVDDVRYPNEASMLKRQGFILIRIVRDDAPSLLTAEQAAHESEAYIDDLPYALTVDASGSRSDFERRLEAAFDYQRAA